MVRGFLIALAVAILPTFASAGTAEDWAACTGHDAEQAIAACTSLASQPDLDSDQRAYAFNNRGVNYGRRTHVLADDGDRNRAISDFAEAIRLKPDFAIAFNNLGQAYLDNGDYNTAMHDFSDAIRIKPDYADAYHNRGDAYFDMARDDRIFNYFLALADYGNAISDYGKAIQLTPNDVDAFVNRGRAYYSKSDYDRAIADFDEAIRLKPDYAFAFNNRGNAYDAKGDYDSAIADYNQAIRLKPDGAEAFVDRGGAYADKGEYDHAVADYNQAIQLKPDFALAFNNRGKTYDEIGDHNRALADYNQSIRLKPDDAWAYANRGIARWQAGQQNDALADLEQALKLYPDLPYARAKLQEYQNAVEAGKLRRSAVHIPGRSVALVIGNSDYPFLPKLPNAVHDAEAVRDALDKLGYKVTYLHDLTYDQTMSAVDDFRTKAASTAEVAVIWYTGHGQSFPADDKASKGAALQSDNYFLPVDFKPGDNIATHGITLGTVIGGAMSANKLQVVVIDACRGLGEKGIAAGFTGIAKPAAPAQGVEPLTDKLLVVYSTQPGHAASDGAEGQHSPFAQAFLDEVAAGDAKNDVRAFFSGVTHATEKAARFLGQDQTPDAFDNIDSGAPVAIVK